MRKFSVVILIFLSGYAVAQTSPLIVPLSEDSTKVTFLLQDVSGIQKIRLVSDLTSYFDNGINIKPENTGWLQKNVATHQWSLTLTVDSRLRLPYRYEITVASNGKDSSYEILDPLNNNIYLKGNSRLQQSVMELDHAFVFPWGTNADTTSYWKKIGLISSVTHRDQDVYIYTPPGFKNTGEVYNVLVALGSYSYGVEMTTARIYQQLYQSGSVKPTVIALVDYKSYNNKADFDSTALYLIQDVLPYLRANYHVSQRAADVTISGISRRGLVASYIAFAYDHYIGNVISLSGGFYWKPDNSDEYEWFSNQMAATPAKKVKYYLSAGNLETVVTATNAGHYLLAVNRHLSNILLAKGYTFLFNKIPGAHNALSWMHGLYDGLLYILAKN